ncbi:CiaD-like domain-containing protein [Caminibacter pacificus]
MDIKETILETLQEIEEEEIFEHIEEEKQECDKEFLKHLRERLLILFDGLQSPNTQNLDVKLDVTLNFLEYLLARLEEKINE